MDVIFSPGSGSDHHVVQQEIHMEKKKHPNKASKGLDSQSCECSVSQPVGRDPQVGRGAVLILKYIYFYYYDVI